MYTSDKRFSRLELALGKENIQRLNNARVTVVGIGGVGGIASETLVRSAIGNLTIVDNDSFQRTDINRQTFALESTMNQMKVDVAARRLMDINPALKLSKHQLFFHTDTLAEILTPAPDFIIDAIDAVLPKVELLAWCFQHSIPVISVMGAAVKNDYSLIKISDISKTEVCPLARIIRKRLRKRRISTGIPCLYSAEPGPPFIQPENITDDEIRSKHTRGRIRPVIGSYGPMVNIFGILAADYVIRSLTSKQT